MGFGVILHQISGLLVTLTKYPPMSSADGGHPQREGGAAGDRHPDDKQEHGEDPQDYCAGQHGAAGALHQEAHRLRAAG